MTFQQRQQAQQQADYDAYMAAEAKKKAEFDAKQKRLNDDALAQQAAQKAAAQREMDAVSAKLLADRDARAEVEVARMRDELRSAWTGTQEQFLQALPTLLANYQQRKTFETLNERQRELREQIRRQM